MTLIRDIACDEVPLLLDGAREFFAEGKLPGKLSPAGFVSGWQNMLTSGMGVLLGAFENHGLIGAIGGAVSLDFPTGDLVATEFFWFARPEHRGCGIRLLKTFERTVKERGAQRIHMVHLVNLNGEAMGELYLRLGYELREKIYGKQL